MVPLFPAGIPGGTEIIVLLLIILVVLIPVVIVGALGGFAYLFGKSRGKAEEATANSQDNDQ